MTSIKHEVIVTEEQPRIVTVDGKVVPEGKIIASLRKNRGKVFAGLGLFFGALAQGQGVLQALLDTAKAVVGL